MVVIYGLLLLAFMPLIVCIIFAIAAFICNIIVIFLEYEIKRAENKIKEIEKEIRELNSQN